jgi:hypothetical protein
MERTPNIFLIALYVLQDLTLPRPIGTLLGPNKDLTGIAPVPNRDPVGTQLRPDQDYAKTQLGPCRGSTVTVSGLDWDCAETPLELSQDTVVACFGYFRNLKFNMIE